MGKAETKAKRADLLETRDIVRARRSYYEDLLERFPQYVAVIDGKLATLAAERATLVKRHEEAATVIAECEAQLASIDRRLTAEPERPAKPDKAGKLLAKFAELANSLEEDELEDLLAQIQTRVRGE